MPRRAETEAKEAFRFTLEVRGRELTDAELQNLVSEATAHAIRDARQVRKGLDAEVELEGGFGGIGEASAVLLVVAAAKLVAEGALTGAATGFGKWFFDKYLAPHLRKRNLLPGNLSSIPSTPTGDVTQKQARKKRKKKSSK